MMKVVVRKSDRKVMCFWTIPEPVIGPQDSSEAIFQEPDFDPENEKMIEVEDFPGEVSIHDELFVDDSGSIEGMRA